MPSGTSAVRSPRVVCRRRQTKASHRQARCDEHRSAGKPRSRWTVEVVRATDRVRHEADERLRTVIDHVEELAPGREVAGAVGDETPLSAFADAVRRFGPDHILVALRASDHSAWQERGLVDRVRQAFPVPLTVFEIDRAGRSSSGPDDDR